MKPLTIAFKFRILNDLKLRGILQEIKGILLGIMLFITLSFTGCNQQTNAKPVLNQPSIALNSDAKDVPEYFNLRPEVERA
ncbi:hypothetical protein [Gelidibacter sediminis]|uniref:hypothetical protein n=1 Tax=Gelidibacter sediminis TaxID=1608710 RepID=UPI0026BF4FF7|nr:hypothetical protein [Gelidibacter sediminis]